jgi:multidrug efflux pump
MKFTDFFIRRPVFATVVNLVLLLAGIKAWYSLNTRQYPKSDIAVVQVKTIYVGASADLVRGFVTTPLERIIASADGIDYIESQSALGLSIINVHLKLNYDTTAALAQIHAKTAQVRNDLPPEAQEPEIELTMSDTQYAQMYISFYSDQLDRSQITDFLTRVVQPKLTAISGVQKADILGARTFAMRLWLKPDKMAALHISPTDVQKALSANNYLAAVGNTKGSMSIIDLVANTDLHSAEEFRNLVLRQQNGAMIRLGDVADVSLGAEDYDTDVRFSGQHATFMGIWCLPTANSLDVIKAVRDMMPEIKKQLPPGMDAGIPYDATEYIQDALHEVWHTLLETLLIVVCVIFLFLGSWRSIIIPVAAMIISLVGALFLMLVFGFTLNLLTLLAIVLSVGLVVDDAIVVVENVERHLHAGLSPLHAAMKGARELVGPVIAMTITLAAVYAPIGIQGGLTGTLFREFAFTLAGAVVVSGFSALTLSPMMASKLLREGDSHVGYAAWINHRFERLRRWYERTLGNSLRWRPVTIGLAFCLMLMGAVFFVGTPKELAPKEDQGVLLGIIQASPNNTIEQTVRYADEVNKAFLSVPETKHTFQITKAFSSFSGMGLKPWSQRHRRADQIMFEVMARTAKIAGVNSIITMPPPLPGGSPFPVEFVIASTAEPAELVHFADELVLTAVESKIFMFADSDLKFDMPQAEIVFDRDKVAALGVNLQQVGADLGTMMGGNFVNRFSIQGRSYKVIPQVERSQRLNPEQLRDFYVSGPPGPNGQPQLVQLSTFAHLEQKTQPRTLNRFQQLNSATIQAAIPPGVPMDKALHVLEDKAKEILPKGFTVDYAGEAREFRAEGNKLNGTLLVSFVLIFLVLAAQFESFRDPFIVLLGSVPLALTGALLFTFLGKQTTLNIYSQVGLITLIGLVSKNGILIVEFANKLQEEGHDKLRAVIQAAGTRLRPILMTSLATVVGHFPLVLATGPGAGARNAIGLVLVSGMIIGTCFTLFIVPAIYVLVARDHRLTPGSAGDLGETAADAADEAALEELELA